MIAEARFATLYGVDIILRTNIGNTTTEIMGGMANIDEVRRELCKDQSILSCDRVVTDLYTVEIK